MILDAQNQLSASQTVTSTAVSTNTIDLGSARDLGPGNDLYAGFWVTETVTAAGAATVNFQIITSAASDLSNPTVLMQTDAIGKAELTAGRKPIFIEIPPSVFNALPVGQRYLGVRYVVGTGPLTAGKFTSYITDEAIGVGQHYPSGYTVL